MLLQWYTKNLKRKHPLPQQKKKQGYHFSKQLQKYLAYVTILR